MVILYCVSVPHTAIISRTDITKTCLYVGLFDLGAAVTTFSIVIAALTPIDTPSSLVLGGTGQEEVSLWGHSPFLAILNVLRHPRS